MPDRSKVMTQTKRDTLVLQVGGFDVGLTTPPSRNTCCYESLAKEEREEAEDPGKDGKRK
jgi:hypothetical protein